MYKIRELEYSFDSLEPFIDTHTLGLHYNKYLKNYLNKLNNLLIQNNFNYNIELEELAKNITFFNFNDIDEIIYNLGGVLNHYIYFNSINSNREKPNIIFIKKIIDTFGSFNNFKKEFKEKALSIKGSGYTFLVLHNNELEIINLFNQDCPYYYDLVPLIGLDMWEHAYFLNYKNNKDTYIDNFFEIIDYKDVNKYFI